MFEVVDMLITAAVLEPVTVAKFTMSPALKPTVAGTANAIAIRLEVYYKKGRIRVMVVNIMCVTINE